MITPNDKRKRQEEVEREANRTASREKELIGQLMRTDAGRWLLSRLVRDFEMMVRNRIDGHNSVDSYRRGRQDYAREFRDIIVRHYGYGALDTLEIFTSEANG